MEPPSGAWGLPTLGAQRLTRPAAALGHGSAFTWALFDVVGREATLLHDRPPVAWPHDLSDVSTLPSGLYVIRAAAGTWSETTRVAVSW